NHSDSRYPDARASPQKPYLSAEGCNQSIPKREHARNGNRCLAELVCDRKPDGLRTAGHMSSHSPILERKEGWQLRWFASYAQAVTANQKPEHPEDMPNLAAVLGFAFWYLLYFVRVNKLSENVCRTFIQDVVRMLRQNERDRE